MSRLIEIDPIYLTTLEADGYEYGYYVFDVLPLIKIQEIQDKEENYEANLPQNVNLLENVIQLQLDNEFCSNIINQLKKGNLIERQPYFVEDYLLHRLVKYQDEQYETVVIPRVLIGQVYTLLMMH